MGNPSLSLCGRAILSIATLCLNLCVSDALAESQPWEGPYFFIQMADPQLGLARKNRDIEHEEKNFRRAIAEANRLGPDFVMICGDMINKAGDDTQVDAYFRIAEGFDGSYPVYLASGNHDVGTVPTFAAIKKYRARFGPDLYTFDRGCCRYIVINSSIIAAPELVSNYEQEQYAWYELQLKQAKKDGARRIFVVQHHAWFPGTAYDPDKTYKLPREVYRAKNRVRYIELTQKYGVDACFAGHTGRNLVGRLGKMEMITTASIGTYVPKKKVKPGFRIIEVYEDRIEHEYYELDDMPEHVELDLGHE